MDKETGRVPRGAPSRTLGHWPPTVRGEGAQTLAPGRTDREGKSLPVARAGQPALSRTLHVELGQEFLVYPISWDC